MSDALSYLMNARPEAMRSYFHFLKSSGEHLDPKIRAIISVITKVDNQTEDGFRQYLPRALQAGASADEILDALLCAFPSLGLTKIVWAIDILLEMDIPEFRPEALGRKPAWQDIVSVDELVGGQATFVSKGGRGYIVYMCGEEIRAYDNHCPHQSTAIHADALEGTELTCPKHGWKFDIRTGDCIARGDRPLRCLEHKVENGKVWVYV